MHMACLDLEGVLLPEVWIAVAEASGLPELRRTTRDEPDYDKLMRGRLEILDRHNLSLGDIQKVLATMQPLPGAKEFLVWLQSQTRVILLSDTFSQFAAPLIAQLDNPVLFCNELVVDGNGKIVNYQLRQKDQKRKSVEAFKSLNFEVIAVGDSYNDLSMMQTASHGILFRPPDSLLGKYPQFPVTRTYEELKSRFVELFNRHG